MATLPKVLINRADYQIGGGVALRLRTQGRCRLPHVRRGIFRLARFAAASRQYAQSQRDPHGDRRGLCTRLEVQAVPGADLRWARPPSRLVLAGLPFTEFLAGVGNQLDRRYLIVRDATDRRWPMSTRTSTVHRVFEPPLALKRGRVSRSRSASLRPLLPAARPGGHLTIGPR
jgi:hypothetical protein